MESRGTNKSIFRNLDWPTVVIYAILVIAGVFSIYAACYDFDHANIFSFDEFSGKQIRWVGLSLILGLIILLVDSRMYETYAFPIYTGMILLLIVTIFVAKDINGSRSWLVFGPMSLQPAEFAKFATALAMAKLFSAYGFTINGKLTNMAKAILIIVVPILLILAQKETGSALVYLSLFFVLYREGMSGLIMFAAICAITFFVVIIKYSENIILGIPAGEFIVYIMIMIIMVGMTAIYAKQPDIAKNIFLWFLGTGVIITIISLCGIEIPGAIFFISIISVACIYCAYLKLRSHIKRLSVIIIVAVISVTYIFSVNTIFNTLGAHQQNRILVSVGKIDDPRGDGYNVNQSKIAIGSGGFIGKGYLNGTQTKLKYVPEQHTDFIFCTIGEEQGFVGSTVIVLLFLALILRILTIAERQPTAFGRVYAYCVASYLILHLVINIGMVIGLCPVIGIPLPFFSYGGSSLWGFTILLFILLRIDAGRREHLSSY